MSRRALPVLLVLALAATALAPATAGGQTFVSMSATTDPAQPTVDEAFAVDVRLESGASTDGVYEVENVTVYAGTDADAASLGSAEPDARLVRDTVRSIRVDGLELDDAGVHTLRVEATLVDGDGDEHVVTTRVHTRVYSPEPLVQVDAATAVPGAWRQVNLTVANRLDAPIRGVSVRIASEDVHFAESERVAASIQGNTDRVLQFRATTEEAGVHDLTVTLTYEDPDGQFREVSRTVSADFTGPSSPGEIRLTGVSVGPADGGGVEVSGSAANVGSQPVDSVVVAVADAENVRAVQPQPEFFVGTVEGSDFASFSVNARLSNNRTTIPLEVTYRVDGVERTTTRTVTYEGPSEPAGAATGGEGGFPVTLAIGAVVLLGLVAGVWRFFR